MTQKAGSLPGEFEIIERYFAPLARLQPGAQGLQDDVCIYSPPAGFDLVLTADAIVSGTHFLADDPPDMVARKLLRVNLSDLAGKGARPVGYLMTLSLPVDTETDWLDVFTRGLAEDQQAFGFTLMGGDTIATPGPLSLSLTAIGLIPKGHAMRRNQAQIGDDIYVTGTIGDAYLGLQILKGLFTSAAGEGRDFLVDRYRLPEPRLAIGEALLASALAHASMDVSDGLIADLGHICSASHCGAVVEADAVPLSPPAHAAVADLRVPLASLITGGDDYEVLFTADPAHAGAIATLAQRSGVAITRIGQIVSSQSGTFRGAVVRNPDGSILSLEATGFRHF